MTKCHKRGRYEFETMFGMLVFRREGRSKFYRGKCTNCGRQHDLRLREVRAYFRQEASA